MYETVEEVVEIDPITGEEKIVTQNVSRDAKKITSGTAIVESSSQEEEVIEQTYEIDPITGEERVVDTVVHRS